MSQKPLDLIRTAITSDDELERLSPILADLTKHSKMSSCKESISFIKKIIKSKQFLPPAKLRALKLLNSCMLVGNVDFLLFAQKKILSRLEILASYKKELSDELRGENLFGKDSVKSLENKTASIEFLKYLLDCIRTWAGEFGKAPDKSDSQFYLSYMRLKESGVKFRPKALRGSIKEEKKNPIQRKSSIRDSIENTLKLYEENTDESLKSDLRDALNYQKGQLETKIQETMASDNSDEVETLLTLMDRLQAALNKNPNVRSQSLYPSLEVKPKVIQKAPESTFDLFDLEIPSNNKFQSANLATNVPSHFPTRQLISPNKNSGLENFHSGEPVYKINSPAQFSNFEFNSGDPGPAYNAGKLSNYENFYSGDTGKVYNTGKPSFDFFPASNKPMSFNPPQVVEKEDPKISSLTLENSQLKEALEYAKVQISERDKIIKNLNIQNSDLINQKDQISIELADTKKRLEALEYEKKRTEELRANLNADYTSNAASKFQEPSKAIEKKSTLDFDLDFILSPSKDSKKTVPDPNPQKKLPNLFDSSSSDEYPPVEQSVAIKPETDLNFRMGNCMEMGVLLENDLIQIGFQLKRQGPELMCIILIGNKAPEPITELVTELQDISAQSFPMILQPIKTTEEVLQNTQTSRMLKAQLIDFTNKIPRLLVSIKSKSIQTYNIKLPFTLTRFIEGRQELPSSIWMEWKKLVFEEDTSVLNLAVFSNFVEMCSFLCLGGAFRIYSVQEIEDLGPTQVLGAGQLGEILIMFSVIVIQQGLQANFSIRCRNNTLRAALASLIPMQISKNPN